MPPPGLDKSTNKEGVTTWVTNCVGGQGLLGVPFKGWNRLIRPLALQDLVNKVPVVVGFHYYTFFNWAINGKVVQLFFWKSHKTSDCHIWDQKSGGLLFQILSLYFEHYTQITKQRASFSFYWKSYYGVSNALSLTFYVIFTELFFVFRSFWCQKLFS